MGQPLLGIMPRMEVGNAPPVHPPLARSCYPLSSFRPFHQIGVHSGATKLKTGTQRSRKKGTAANWLFLLGDPVPRGIRRWTNRGHVLLFHRPPNCLCNLHTPAQMEQFLRGAAPDYLAPTAAAAEFLASATPPPALLAPSSPGLVLSAAAEEDDSSLSSAYSFVPHLRSSVQQFASSSISPLSPSLFAPNAHQQNVPEDAPSGVQIFVYGFVLVLIPTATILGNMLVIISVLRFKSLHSAINFLILGLAVADLMVALFVMPYACYVYVQGGHWLLGPLMCNLYLSSDVACSTASITLLALISFDRYQAISHPIQYSHQSQNICRVVKLFIGVWVYSLLVACPIVLGFNEPPVEEPLAPFECRFYNAWFSLLSSLVSFVLPCFVVIFVYLRIIRALARRERAAKLRKANSLHQRQLAEKAQANNVDVQQQESFEEAGEIVAGPAVNMMMIALPSLNRQIKRYERHKRALEEAEDKDLSSSDSLSEDVRILTNDFLSEGPTSNSKTSNWNLEPTRGSSLLGLRSSFSGLADLRKKSVPAEEIVPSIFQPRKRSACDVGAFSPPSRDLPRKKSVPISRMRHSHRDGGDVEGQRTRLLEPLQEERRKTSEGGPRREKTQHPPCRGALSFPLVRHITLGRDIRVNHYLLTEGECQTEGEETDRERGNKGLRMNGGGRAMVLGRVESDRVIANRTEHKMENGALPSTVSFQVPNLHIPPAPFRRGSSAIELSTHLAHTEVTYVLEDVPTTTHAEALASLAQPLLARDLSASTACCADQTTTPTSGEEKRNGGNTADALSRERSSRRDRHASLRRKVHKSQRKEKRATKTLGIVVGTFLCCWVPFFSLNIANALCVEMALGWCQVGFGPFFYSTWIGYMNSFMNPVIYTIFNAEFRRAFKSLLLGRRGNMPRRI